MSSTVWLVLENSKTGTKATLQDDYIKLTSAIPDLAKDCKKLKVADINEFVDYTDAAEGLGEEIIEEEDIPKFENKELSQLIVTLRALETVLRGEVKREAAELRKICEENLEDYDRAALTFIM